MTANSLQTRDGVFTLSVSLQMIQAIQVLRFHLLELEKVNSLFLFPFSSLSFQPHRREGSEGLKFRLPRYLHKYPPVISVKANFSVHFSLQFNYNFSH